MLINMNQNADRVSNSRPCFLMIVRFLNSAISINEFEIENLYCFVITFNLQVHVSHRL